MPYTIKRAQKLLIGFICVLLVMAVVVPMRISADSGKTITLECSKDEVVIAGMRWKLFHAGERNGSEFVFTGDFADCQADMSDMSVENISRAAQTVESYVIEKMLAPIAEGYTDSSGKLSFSGLSDGLYLAVGYPVEIEPYYYEPSPLLMEVRSDKDSFVFDAYPKIIRVTLSDRAVAYTVRKVWLDNDDLYEARPNYVTVDIFRNEELYDTVTLNEENEWEYRWAERDTAAQWRVAERVVPADYEVRIEHNETQFLIRNRHKTVTDWDEGTRTTTSTTNTTTTTTTTAVTTSEGTSKTTVPPTTSVPPTTTTSLPQTGQLWWPVLPLVIGGLLMIAVSLMLRPRGKNE